MRSIIRLLPLTALLFACSGSADEPTTDQEPAPASVHVEDGQREIQAFNCRSQKGIMWPICYYGEPQPSTGDGAEPSTGP